MSDKLKINEWAEEDRPREKLMRLGPEQLSTAELLAILIGSGSADENAVDLMKRVLTDCSRDENGRPTGRENLNRLGKMSIDELTRYRGLGPAKAITILAACELGKRRQAEEVLKRKDMGSPDAIYNFMTTKMKDLDVEEAWVILMNQNYKFIAAEQISHGGISETSVDVRVVLKKALLCNATILALCHNHPSNNPTPSKVDDQITKRLKDACDIMRIHMADHLIITDGQYYSYREHGRL